MEPWKDSESILLNVDATAYCFLERLAAESGIDSALEGWESDVINHAVSEVFKLYKKQQEGFDFSLRERRSGLAGLLGLKYEFRVVLPDASRPGDPPDPDLAYR